MAIIKMENGVEVLTAPDEDLKRAEEESTLARDILINNLRQTMGMITPIFPGCSYSESPDITRCCCDFFRKDGPT